VQTSAVSVDALQDGRVVTREEAADFAEAIVAMLAQLPPQFLTGSRHCCGSPAVTEFLARDTPTATDVIDKFEQAARA
jgi:hypothetical protein